MFFLQDFIEFDYLKRSLLAILLASIASGIVGGYVVARRQSYLISAVSHSLLGGIGLARYLQIAHGLTWFSTILGALFAAILSAIAISTLTLKNRMRQDTVLSAIWTLGVAIGVSFIAITPGYSEDFTSYLFGSILLVSKMDIAEKRKPLDGRFTVRYKGSEVDLRVSSFPISLRKRGVCEKIVMRILDPNSGQFPLKDMGFDPRVFKQFIDAINAPNGIVLVTGPTGSGKSTTLYASIREILDSTINISTMEDPVELNIDGVNQGQINNAAGFTFAAGIRALLRQDPDVIMIGEMRDQETSSMAIEAALTGHLVFSTLHTNDAAGSFPRLLEMGLEPFLVSTAIKGILAQRLVRRICKYCKEPVEISDSLREELHLSPDMQFYHGKGCDKCDGSGYKGRCGIYEFLVPNETVRNLIIKRSSGDVIKRAAMKECGMITLRMDGIQKALDGHTTLEQAVGASAADD